MTRIRERRATIINTVAALNSTGSTIVERQVWPHRCSHTAQASINFFYLSGVIPNYWQSCACLPLTLFNHGDSVMKNRSNLNSESQTSVVLKTRLNGNNCLSLSQVQIALDSS